MAGGRPSGYSEAVADAICAQIAQGISLRAICSAEGMPDCRTVWRWRADMPEFYQQYARAMEERAEHLAQDIIAVADEPVPSTAQGGLDSAAVSDKKLRVDARKWVASKLMPKVYGDKQAVELTGKDGGPVETADKSPVESARAIAFALAMGLRAKAKEPDSPPPAGEDLC